MEQDPALEFVLLHIYYYIFISDFWAKGRRVYRSTNQVWLYGYMCPFCWCDAKKKKLNGSEKKGDKHFLDRRNICYSLEKLEI